MKKLIWLQAIGESMVKKHENDRVKVEFLNLTVMEKYSNLNQPPPRKNHINPQGGRGRELLFKTGECY
jgi:hypothetical protein